MSVNAKDVRDEDYRDGCARAIRERWVGFGGDLDAQPAILAPSVTAAVQRLPDGGFVEVHVWVPDAYVREAKS